MKAKLWILLLAFFVIFPSLAQVTPDSSTVENIVETTVVSELDTLIPNQGFTINSLWRGVLGMAVLIFIAFLFSSNRKAINWKTAGIGLSIQLLIAIGVLKIPFIQTIFESIGKVFVSILDFTRAGSQFLFEGLVADMNTFGYIFCLSSTTDHYLFLSLNFSSLLFGHHSKGGKGSGLVTFKSLTDFGRRKFEYCRQYIFRSDGSTAIDQTLP